MRIVSRWLHFGMFWLAVTALAAAAESAKIRAAQADDAEPPVLEAGTRERLVAAERSLAAAESAIKAIETHLGRSVHPPTPTRNIERRLQDVEKRLDAIERSLKKMDALDRKVNQLENQVRRVEGRR
jgi:cell division protein FtsB